MCRSRHQLSVGFVQFVQITSTCQSVGFVAERKRPSVRWVKKRVKANGSPSRNLNECTTTNTLVGTYWVFLFACQFSRNKSVEVIALECGENVVYDDAVCKLIQPFPNCVRRSDIYIVSIPVVTIFLAVWWNGVLCALQLAQFWQPLTFLLSLFSLLASGKRVQTVSTTGEKKRQQQLKYKRDWKRQM